MSRRDARDIAFKLIFAYTFDNYEKNVTYPSKVLNNTIIETAKNLNYKLHVGDITTMDVFGPAEPKKVPEIRYPDECWHCRACVIDCPAGAIDLRYPLPYMMLTRTVRD